MFRLASAEAAGNAVFKLDTTANDAAEACDCDAGSDSVAEKQVPEDRGAGHTGGAARRLATVQLAVFNTARGTASTCTERKELVDTANGEAAESTDNLASFVCTAPKRTQMALALALVLALEFGETRRDFARRARRNDSDTIAGATCKEAIERSHWAPTPAHAGRQGRADPNPSEESEASLRERNFENLWNRIKSKIICGKITENYFYKK